MSNVVAELEESLRRTQDESTMLQQNFKRDISEAAPTGIEHEVRAPWTNQNDAANKPLLRSALQHLILHVVSSAADMSWRQVLCGPCPKDSAQLADTTLTAHPESRPFRRMLRPRR